MWITLLEKSRGLLKRINNIEGILVAQGSLKIGRLFGIDIEIHWTLLLLLLLALFVSASDFLLFIIIILLFICVLVHELAHSLVAMHNGIKVREIVLNIIGGASVIDTVGIDPSVEFMISVVGPLMSLLLGGVFGLLVIFSGVGTLTYILQFLFEINILLGIFNLLPAFPMDGGRVLRSWLMKTKSEYNATRATVKVSYAVIGAIVVLSLAYVLVINASVLYRELYFFIFLIMAIFLYGGTQAEMQSTIMKKEMSGINVSRIFSDSFVLIDSNSEINRLYSIALEKKEHVILTKINGKVMAIDPFRGRSGSVSSIAQLAIPVAVMSKNTGLFDAMSMINASGSGMGVVVFQDRVLGIVTSQRIQAFIYLHMLKKKRKAYKQ